jgi:serine/threonine protein kinase
MYLKIQNPITHRKVSINSKLGRDTISNYIKQIGGDINRQQFIDYDGVEIQDFYAYAMLCKNNLITNLNVDGSKCNGNPEDIQLLFAGTNGLALEFICNNGLIYTMKLLFEYQQTYEGVLMADVKKKYENDILTEYKVINQFDSPYIMKAIKYFLFEPTEQRFILSSDVDVPRRTLEYINVPDLHMEHWEYRQPERGHLLERVSPPFFGGMILENVQYRFENLPPDYFYLALIFLQYVTGLKEINDKGYIHKDIKPDNLMYNYKNEEYTAKIIDLGTVYNIITATESFTPASVSWMPQNDITILQGLTVRSPALSTRSRTEADKTIINSITNSYDLYCLCKSFLQKFDIDKQSIFYTVLTEGIHENHTERIKNDDAIRKIDKHLFKI